MSTSFEFKPSLKKLQKAGTFKIKLYFFKQKNQKTQPELSTSY